MTKTQRSAAVLLMSCWFVACGGHSSQDTTGTAGGGGGGAAGGAGGQAGQPSDASVAVDGAVYPNDAGKCPMQGAFPRAGGICVCQALSPTVCDNVCVDTQSDNDHCGACATKCPATSSCNGGTCTTPPTVVLAAPQPVAGADGGAASCGPLRLAAAGATLYWTDTVKGTVNSMPTAGGAPTVIASGQMAPTHLQVAGGSLFWLDSGEKKIMKAALSSAGTPALVVAAPATDSEIGGFAVTPDGLTVYFSSTKTDTTARPEATISKVAATGGTITVVAAQDHGVPAAVAIDGNTVAFPVSGNGDVNAISVVAGTTAQCGVPPADGGTVELDVNCSRLGRSQGELFLDDIFAFGGSAYWLDGQSLKTGVVSNNTSGTYDTITASLGGGAFSAFTLDGTANVFLAEEGSTNCVTWKDANKTDCGVYGPATPGVIQKAPLVKDATAVPLARVVDPKDATHVLGVTSVAVGASNVYYATDDCAILSAAK